MGWFSRLTGREATQQDARPLAETRSSTSLDTLLWGDMGWGTESLTGLQINQYTSLNATGVLACVSMLSEDVAKLPWSIFRNGAEGEKKEAKDHYLYDILQSPNEWQDDLEFREQMQGALILRGNAYAAIVRNGRGIPVRLVPINPDWCALWETAAGGLFYFITAQGLHMQAMLRGLPNPLPAEDMLHLKGFSSNGLVGSSRIRVAREAIALSLAQEQTAARFVGNGARPSGMLTTDQKLSDTAAARLRADIKENWNGLQNAGKLIIGEQGLKFEKFNMTASDIEFIASRKFQLEEIGRIFRIPLHMLGELTRCMPADTLVYTEQGPVRIADVKIGDRVWSADQSGLRLSKVLNNWENGVDDLIEVSTTNRRFRCNRKHRVLVRRPVVRALRKGEIGGRNSNDGCKRRIEWISEYVEAGALSVGDTLVTLDRLPSSQNNRTAPNGRKLTADFMAFCGLLLGDGNITKVKGRPVGVQIARSDRALYMDEYRRIIRAEFVKGGFSRAWGERHHHARLSSAQVELIRSVPFVRGNDKRIAAEIGVHRSAVSYARKGNTWGGPVVAPTGPVLLVEGVRQTVFKSVLAGEELDDLGFGGTARTKRVPGWVFEVDEDLRLALVRGFLDADGTVNKAGRIAFDSSSRPLLDDIRHLCMGAGIPVTNIQEMHNTSCPPESKRAVYTHMFRFTCSDPGQNARVGSFDPRYVERIASGKAFNRKGRAYPRHGGKGFDLRGASLSAITEIRDLPPEPVFDLEVEDTHNFIADGVIVHNSTNNNIAQQAQEYINFTLTGYANRWKRRLAKTFDLHRDNVYIDFDYRELTRADITSRINDWRTAIMSMIATPDEARIDLGLPPKGGEAAKLHYPANMATQGSQSTGTQPDGGGRPASDEPPVKTYATQYEKDGKTFGAEVTASSWEEAQLLVDGNARGETVVGEIVEAGPV